VFVGYLNTEQIKKTYTHSLVDVTGESAVLVDRKTGEILYSKNEHKKLYPASTTKLLTALVVLENSSPDEEVMMGEEVYLRTEGEARVGLYEGQVQTVEALLGAMLLESGNDAARSLAAHTAKKVMNENLSVGAANQYFAGL